MQRRFNFTGRRSLYEKHFSFSLAEVNGVPRLTADLSGGVKGHGLPDEAAVYVEAYFQANWMRFCFGTVGALVPPPDLRLTEFALGETVRLRVKVVDQSSTRGLLLAEVQGVPCGAAEDAEGDGRSLLRVKGQRLVGEMYRVVFDTADTGFPVLLVDNKLAPAKTIVKSAHFRSLVMPAVLREVLVQVRIIDEDLSDEGDGWRFRWTNFAALSCGAGPPPTGDDAEEQREWINRAVEAFGAGSNIAAQAQFATLWAGE
jgi:hypothetical protein